MWNDCWTSAMATAHVPQNSPRVMNDARTGPGAAIGAWSAVRAPGLVTARRDRDGGQPPEGGPALAMNLAVVTSTRVSRPAPTSPA